jgi:hypothetical protein
MDKAALELLREKASKQVQAADMVVENQKAQLLVAEEALAVATESVAFLKRATMKAVSVSIDLQCVKEWLDRQE